jgi:hypothetical protein
MEVKVGFEPTILRICSPLPWAARPLHHYCRDHCCMFKGQPLAQGSSLAVDSPDYSGPIVSAYDVYFW